MLTLEMLNRLWPRAKAELRQGIVDSAPAVFEKYDFSSKLVVAHFMAQISHECGAGIEIVENLNYSASRMMQVWPGRFPTLRTAEPYTHNPKALADKVYNGRMGNAPGSDDGWNFRGRGAAQTTGRNGYALLKQKTGIDVLSNPDLVAASEHFLEFGAADFVICGCLPYAKADDVKMVTKRLNGGLIGLDQRVQWLARWKKELGK